MIPDENEKIMIGIITNGGAGSLFLQANFMFCLKQYLSEEPVEFIVYGHKQSDLNYLVFSDGQITDFYYDANDQADRSRCDVLINLNFYPEILLENERVEKSKKLSDLLQVWRSFLEEDATRKFNMVHPYYDVQAYVHSIINRRNCVNAFDINGYMGMTDDYIWHLDVGMDEAYLEHIGVLPNQYITLQTGATPGSGQLGSTKIWSGDRFAEFINIFKRLFPKIKVIQLGEKENSVAIKGVDVDLLGKTSWREVSVLLKGAWLHIDGECGMVHLRKAMDAGPSIVLFGPTPVEFYGYKGNINIRTDSCPYWCARTTESWALRCTRGDDEPRCMTSITAGNVMERILRYARLEKVKSEKRDIDTKNKELYSESKICIDLKYRENFLDRMLVLDYEIVDVRVGDLLAHFPVDARFDSHPLKDSPAYAMAEGNVKTYEEYTNDLRTYFGDKQHTVKKCNTLFEQLDKSGYDSSHLVIIDMDNLILDGQHRASWLMSRFGEDHIIKALRLYAIKDDEHYAFFPFDKVERGSRVVLYGAGITGLSYIRELDYTGYAKIVMLVDRNYIDYNEKREEESIECHSPDEIKGISLDLYDYILICNQNVRASYEIFDKLLSIGVPESRIVSKLRLKKNKEERVYI